MTTFNANINDKWHTCKAPNFHSEIEGEKTCHACRLEKEKKVKAKLKALYKGFKITDPNKNSDDEFNDLLDQLTIKQ